MTPYPPLTPGEACAQAAAFALAWVDRADIATLHDDELTKVRPQVHAIQDQLLSLLRTLQPDPLPASEAGRAAGDSSPF